MMHARTINRLLIAVLLAMGMSLSIGCRQQPAPSDDAETRTIIMGGVYPLTGPLSVFGQAAREGLLAGVEYANRDVLAETPFRIQAFVEDSQGDPTVGVTAYRRLVDGRKASVINVVLSPVAVALKPLADQDSVLLFADATHSALRGGLTLRHSQTAEQEATALLNHGKETLNITRILAIVADDDYGESFIRTLGDRASVLRYDAQASDLRPLSRQAAARDPEAMIIVGIGGPLGEIIRQVRESGFEGPILSTLGFDAIPSTRQVAGAAARGVYYTQLVQDPDALSSAAGQDITVPALAGASAMKVVAFNNVVFLAQALAAGEMEPSAIRQHLLEQEVLMGVGTVATPQPDGTLLPQLQIVQNP